ncbi:GntR family transcriptional regulator [Clostridium celatum]|uniref:Transcriptional regulator, GntR family n=1 Tax=Clostridium celatum DSM 1785 TaxID=545697 RepID=L1QKV9_9CLOT|nr:GntR family transcriptional regulator [Clostridium celatum]EKY28207.1 transcriptional regulator, GntR family [Clostridium celatum DSM 1785]MCE9654040.1 GntR family transcriptional regulator [Clostridium celatum]MDU2266655.1 GntR family transcriptional regulator [Clostridium celatum]MDU3724554.1 GntR family transcriptional regulator [Clostridium celatum]MDU6296990.1 GntR family transcriptional regulator [Clostridium celatum]
MNLEFTNDVPIYIQIAQSIEDSILKDIFKENEMIPSTTEISVKYKINPATVAKGFNILVNEGIIYKRRGIGMFVSEGSKELLINRRKERFFNDYIISLLDEAKKLNISKEDVIKMIQREV